MATQYAFGKIITDGLVLCLDAADRNSYVSGSTTWRDVAGSNNGTLTNGPTFNSTNGGSIVFDGTNDYVSVPNCIRTGVGFSGTVEIITNCTGSLLFNERTDNFGGDGYFLVTSGSTLSIGVNSLNALPYTYFLTSSIAGNLNQINHYIASYTIPTTTGTMSGILGINGQFETLSSSISVGGTMSNFTTVDIGRQKNYVYGTTYSSSGRVYIVRIYNRRLSQSEMLQNFNAQKSRFGL
jgi:hypothetical protein